MRTHPLQPCVTPLPDTHIIDIFLPRPLPMDEDVDIVFFDHNPFDLELEVNGGKGLEIHVDLPLQFVQLTLRQQHGMEPGPILSFIGAPQGFQRVVYPEESLVLCRVSDGLRWTPNRHHGEH